MKEIKIEITEKMEKDLEKIAKEFDCKKEKVVDVLLEKAVTKALYDLRLNVSITDLCVNCGKTSCQCNGYSDLRL
jgi:hypothetical protein